MGGWCLLVSKQPSMSSETLEASQHCQYCLVPRNAMKSGRHDELAFPVSCTDADLLQDKFSSILHLEEMYGYASFDDSSSYTDSLSYRSSNFTPREYVAAFMPTMEVEMQHGNDVLSSASAASSSRGPSSPAHR